MAKMKELQFGQNFRDNLLEDYNENSLRESQKFLTEFLETDTLNGLSFLDAGCGSGAFTAAALQLGAKVTSFDIDPVAIDNTRQLLQRFSMNNSSVSLLIGSVLDKQFVSTLGGFDVVLCWGVSHHSGNLWGCLGNISESVKLNGKVHLGIYNKADGFAFYPDGRFGPSSFWKKIKRWYVSLPTFLQQAVDACAVAGIFAVYLLTFNNPIKKLHSNERRGMNWKSDIKDWLIGYPYEYATPEEVFEFMKARGFALEKIRTNNGLLTNNYVFRKVSG